MRGISIHDNAGFSRLQRAYDNATPNDDCEENDYSYDPDPDDYEDESYYRSKEYSRMMDAYENRMDRKYE